jgi:hypothetical protein
VVLFEESAVSRITDHAVLRYLERHHGIDVEGIRTSMNVKGIDVAAAFGCATVKLGNGSRLKLRATWPAPALNRGNTGGSIDG